MVANAETHPTYPPPDLSLLLLKIALLGNDFRFFSPQRVRRGDQAAGDHGDTLERPLPFIYN